jgi:hypothetical protein
MLFDGSYFRINQIQLGYTIPHKLLDFVKLGDVRVYTSLDDISPLRIHRIRPGGRR